MEIEIKFGQGRTDRVLVHYGDDPLDLAQVLVFTGIVVGDFFSFTQLYLFLTNYFIWLLVS